MSSPCSNEVSKPRTTAPSTDPTSNRWTVSKRILRRTVKAANLQRAKEGLAPIVGVTNHSLRRTFASLCYDAGASPAYVMAAMGHSSSALALEVYAKTMSRERETGARMGSHVRGVEKAQTGTNGDSGLADVLSAATETA
jgi:integrase